MQRFLLRGGRVVVHTVVGGVLLVAGTVMLATPGPGVVVVVLGLAILAREYDWAERLKRRVTDRVRDASTAARARLAARRGGSSEPVTGLPGSAAEGATPGVLDADDAPGDVRPAS